MSTKEERAWAGSQSSYEAALEVEAGIAKLRAAGQYEDEPRDTPRLLTIDGGIATIDVKGPLMNSGSFMLEMFGATGYPEIREALVAAVNDMSVKEIFLDIDSGGGAVSGCGDTADLIRAVNAIKPVTAFTDSVMASAAYWLGSSAGEVYSGRAALVGSIGVKATFKEYTKQNEMEGVTVTVIRAGKYKALADSNEKLTPEAEAQIKAVVDATYEVFVNHVAEMRGKTYAYTDKTMADGQEFIGQACVDVGLTDGVTTYDAVIGDLRRKVLDSLPKTMDNHGNHSGSLSRGLADITGAVGMAKKALTEQDIAALAAGASGAVTGEAAAEAAAIEAAAAELAAAEAAAVEAAAAELAAAEAAAAAVEAEAAKDLAKNSETVQLLTSQLKDKDAELVQAKVELTMANQKLADATANIDPLTAIAAASLSNMSVALGGAAVTCEGLSAAQVVAEHARLATQFKAKFHVGGVAATGGNQAAQQVTGDPRRMARVSAARYSK